jgi:hypothetical protein
VSLLDARGRPGITERALIVPPGSQLGPLTETERARLIASSAVAGVYDKAVDRESAYERLKSRTEEAAANERAPARQPSSTVRPDSGSLAQDILFGRRGPRGGRQSQGMIEALANSAARSVGSQAGRALIRGLLGSLLGGTRR